MTNNVLDGKVIEKLAKVLGGWAGEQRSGRREGGWGDLSPCLLPQVKPCVFLVL